MDIRSPIRAGIVAAAMSGAGCAGRTVSVGSSADTSAGERPAGAAPDAAMPDASVRDVAVPEAAVDAAACMILASQYDPSCATTDDCVEITEGDYCQSICECGGAAIGKGGEAQFRSAVAATPLGAGRIPPAECGCPLFNGPCCRQGKCQMGAACVAAPGDTLAACADAGGTCIGPGNLKCYLYGPADACALPDESCCLP